MATAIKRDKLKIDAEGRSIGRVASEAAKFLMGKHKPQYEPQWDFGDFVEVRNAAKVKLLGSKIDQKKYYSYSGYPGGIKARGLKEIMAKNPGDAIRRAVSRMLPKNTHRTARMKRLTVHND